MLPAGGGAKHRQQAMKRKRGLTGSDRLFPRQASASNPLQELRMTTISSLTQTSLNEYWHAGGFLISDVAASLAPRILGNQGR